MMMALFTALALSFLASTVLVALSFDDARAWMLLHYLSAPFHFGLSRRLLARAVALGPPSHAFDEIDLDSATTVSGDVLTAVLMLPRDDRARSGTAPRRWPTVLMRTPYGRHDLELGQRLLAERGFAVVIQDTRGRFGSEGEFVPVAHELDDGASTIEWAMRQPWCDEKRIGVYGASYLGFTAWACVGGRRGGDVKAAVVFCSCSCVRDAVFYPGGAFALQLVALWLALVLRVLPDWAVLRDVFVTRRVVDASKEEDSDAKSWYRRLARGAAAPRALARSVLRVVSLSLRLLDSLSVMVRAPGLLRRTPLKDLDLVVGRRRLPFVQEVLADPKVDGAFWREANVLCDLDAPRETFPAVHIFTGWHDIFARGAFHDWERIQRSRYAGCRLTVYDGAHFDLMQPNIFRAAISTVLFPTMRQALAAPSRDSSQGASSAAAPEEQETVRVQLARARDFGWRSSWFDLPWRQRRDEWRALPSWHDGGAGHLSRLKLAQGGSLQWCESESDQDRVEEEGCAGSYRYDAADATPSAGGATFLLSCKGQRCQRQVEARADVAVFTTEPLLTALEICGRVELDAAVALPLNVTSIDVVARLCVVSRKGTSSNVCEGLSRLTTGALAAAAGGFTRVTVDLGLAAVALQDGERLRLDVCSAAAPRWMHNPTFDFDGEPENIRDIAAVNDTPSRPVLVRLGDRNSTLKLPLLPKLHAATR